MTDSPINSRKKFVFVSINWASVKPENIVFVSPASLCEGEGIYKTTPTILIVCGSQLGTGTGIFRLERGRSHFEAYGLSYLLSLVEAVGLQDLEHKRPRELLVQECVGLGSKGKEREKSIWLHTLHSPVSEIGFIDRLQP